jgi:hypothetical protein
VRPPAGTPHEIDHGSDTELRRVYRTKREVHVLRRAGRPFEEGGTHAHDQVTNAQAIERLEECSLSS